jgi:hypothetical protein
MMGNLGHCLLERHLHLGQCRDRHGHRQIGIEDVVLAHVGVRQHVVAELLRIP